LRTRVVGGFVLTLAAALAFLLVHVLEVSNAELSRLTMPSPLPTVTPYYEWPTYLARDYRKTGQPQLTGAEVTKLRNTLAVIKPCQRAFLRYAFPKNSDFLRFVMFFEPSVASKEEGGDLRPAPHIFGEGNADYKPWSGEAFVTPYWESDKIGVDVKDRGCSP
jgi:hypothetical protein